MSILKIRFTKIEAGLMMQILEQDIPFTRKDSGFVQISTFPDLIKDCIYLRGSSSDDNYYVSKLLFENNEQRDAYLEKAVKAISDEIFDFKKANDDFEIGEIYDVGEDKVVLRKLIAILPKKYKARFIVAEPNSLNGWIAHNSIRPKSAILKVKELSSNDIIYTWIQ